jgi:phosphopantothenoylcysteine synthetase/decarboxylase
MRNILIMGGGTFQPISNHLSLSAPAFGTVADEIGRILFHRYDIYVKQREKVLTKMADSRSHLVTNEDVKNYVMEAIKDPKLGIIFMSVAFCDFQVDGGDFHGQRLETSEGEITLNLKPTEKVLDLIRREQLSSNHTSKALPMW